MKIYYIYVDFLLLQEELKMEEAFYVGKGLQQRVNKKERNRYWQSVVKKYQWRRDVIFASKDEKYILEMEQFFIKSFGTYVYDTESKNKHKCNLTIGGEGCSGMKWSEETRQRMEEWWANNSHPLLGIPLTEEHKQNLSKRFSGEGSNTAKLTWREVEEIRIKYLSGEYSIQQLADMYKMSKAPIVQIINNKRWISEDYGKILLQLDSNWKKDNGNKFLVKNRSTTLLDNEKVEEIRNKYKTGKYTQTELAEEYKISRGAISLVLKNERWSKTKDDKITEEEYIELKQEISKNRSGENHPLFGTFLSEETKNRISENRKGKCVGKDNPFFGRTGTSHPSFGKKLSQEQKIQIAEAQSGENSHTAKLTLEQVLEIRQKYNNGTHKIFELVKEYKVSRGCITQIVKNRTWKNTNLASKRKENK